MSHPRGFQKMFLPRSVSLFSAIAGLFLFAPYHVFAAAAEVNTFAGLIRIFTNVLTSAIPALFSLALLLFFWGVAKFILNTSDEKVAAEGRETMFYGVIALFVIFSIWGIVRLLEFTFFPAIIPIIS